MEEFTWDKEKFSVGVDEIDNQHQQLFNLLSKLQQAINDELDVLKIYDSVDEILNYIDTHLQTEEKYFDNSQLANSHRAVHSEFSKNIENIVKDVMDAEEDEILQSTAVLIVAVRSWLVQHVLGTDKEMFSRLGYSGLANTS